MIYAIYIDHNIVQFYFTIQFSIKFHLIGIYCFFWQKSRVIMLDFHNTWIFHQSMGWYWLIIYCLKFLKSLCMVHVVQSVSCFSIFLYQENLWVVLCNYALCNLKTNLIKTLHSVIKCISCHELKRTNYSVE